MDFLGMAAQMDHTLLKPTVTVGQVRAACAEARELGVASIYVPPVHVVGAVRTLAGAQTQVGTVAGFPLGFCETAIKAEETARALAQGAQWIDVVINTGALREGDDLAVFREIQEIVRVASGMTVKVILEATLLDNDEKRRACEICRDAGADFVQTSTGYGPGGATIEDVRLLKEHAGPVMGVAAAGGIRDPEKALAMFDAGASRITSSNALKILRQLNERASHATV